MTERQHEEWCLNSHRNWSGTHSVVVMALRAVTGHPKFAMLKEVLHLTNFEALGCLEMIWHFTARFTPEGNIGKYSNEAIETWVDWDGKPGELIEALISCAWIDADKKHRLVVHDWHEHTDAMVHTDLARRLLRFTNGTVPNSGRLNEHERARFRTWLECEGLKGRPPGRPAKSQTKSSH